MNTIPLISHRLLVAAAARPPEPASPPPRQPRPLRGPDTFEVVNPEDWLNEPWTIEPQSPPAPPQDR